MYGITDASYALSVGGMVEETVDLFRLGEIRVFESENGQRTANAGLYSSPEKAIDAWAHQMMQDGWELAELPHRHGFGLIYSVCPRDGGESVLYGGEVDKCRGQSVE